MTCILPEVPEGMILKQWYYHIIIIIVTPIALASSTPPKSPRFRFEITAWELVPQSSIIWFSDLQLSKHLRMLLWKPVSFRARLSLIIVPALCSQDTPFQVTLLKLQGFWCWTPKQRLAPVLVSKTHPALGAWTPVMKQFQSIALDLLPLQVGALKLDSFKSCS